MNEMRKVNRLSGSFIRFYFTQLIFIKIESEKIIRKIQFYFQGIIRIQMNDLLLLFFISPFIIEINNNLKLFYVTDAALYIQF